MPHCNCGYCRNFADRQDDRGPVVSERYPGHHAADGHSRLHARSCRSVALRQGVDVAVLRSQSQGPSRR